MLNYKNNLHPVDIRSRMFGMKWWIGALLCLMAAVSWAAPKVVLQKVDVTTLPGDEVEIRFGFDGTPPMPQGYEIEKPARISLDLVGVKSGLASKHQSLGTGNAQSMTVLDTADRTRVIFNLGELTGYTSRVEGNNLIVTVGKNQHAAQVATVTSGPARSSEKSISNVDFRRGDQGDGQLLLDLSVPGISVDVKQQGSRIIAKLPGAKLPERLRHRLDVTDFATPVKTVDLSTDASGTLVVIQPVGEFEYLAYQADNHFTISVKPLSTDSKRRKDLFTYSGEKLSLNFQDIDVRSVLQLIADFTSLNLVASDTVSGKITLRLQNVPWDQALDLILKTKGLDKRTIGNVMLVAPADEIANREKAELEANQQVDNLAVLRTEFIQVSYAKAADMTLLAQKVVSAKGGVATDSRTNTVIVHDSSKKIEEIREMITRLDIPVRQVMIEARVVLANSSYDKELGVTWGESGSRINNQNGTALLFGGSNKTLLDSWTWVGSPTGTRVLTYPDNLMVDMGARQTGGSSFALGFMNNRGDLLDLELSAFQSEGHGEVVASPRVMTTDKQKARVASGQQIPYQQATSSGATATAFINAELSLEVTPSITPDGRIQMDLVVNKDSPSKAQSNNQLLIDTNSIKTNVLVNDGETVVLGGIYQTSVVKGQLKTPLLGDIPYLGALFRKDTNVSTKQELLIFITPRIYSDVAANK